ncbi:MAG: hypothetical protein WC292_04290 [Clostridia bacterium]
MKATEKDILTAKLFIKAAFPVLKVVLQEDSSFTAKWKDTKAVVQFRAKDEDGDLVSYIAFDNLNLTVQMEEYPEKPDIEFTFSSIKKFVTMLKGGPAVPDIGSLLKALVTKPALTINTLMALMKLKLMLPSVRPKDDLNKYLKVKLSLYMITTALSVANKLGWEGIKNWTMQPDRIYQFAVGDVENPVIACYLRVKGGNSKAGRGMYARKTPFVLFHFLSVDGAINVLLKTKEFVASVAEGDVEIVGAPEYGAQLNDTMAVLQSLLTTL